MNLILLFPEDVPDPGFCGGNFFHVRLTGRRHLHILDVLRAKAGDELHVGLLNHLMGKGRITSLDQHQVEMEVHVDTPPPPPLPVNLVVALPRPKVLNRIIAAAASLGVKRIALINAWRVERSYWKSPRLQADQLRRQLLLGLEQARDTLLPEVTLHRLFRKFAEEELPAMALSSHIFIAHPGGENACPGAIPGNSPSKNVPSMELCGYWPSAAGTPSVNAPSMAHFGYWPSLAGTTLVVGPEGGFIQPEIDSLQKAGGKIISLGQRILRVETALPYLLSRIYPEIQHSKQSQNGDTPRAKRKDF